MNARITRRGGVGMLVVVLLAGLLVSGVTPDRARAAGGRVLRRIHMMSLTNSDRRQRDRARLTLNDRLSHIAKRHSREMAAKGYLFHSSSEQLVKELSPYDWSLGGENVGVGDSLEGLESAFMHSKEHRRNILRRQFDHAAVGIVRVDGKLWVTVIFYG